MRSADGTEFDNSYDKGQPLPVKLGAGSVIKGWDQGLVGAQAGERLQLDIPADLAYGDNPSGEIIQPGDALSFVIDVLAVVPATTAADQPQVDVAGAANRSDLLDRGPRRRHRPGAAERPDRRASSSSSTAATPASRPAARGPTTSRWRSSTASTRCCPASSTG